MPTNGQVLEASKERVMLVQAGGRGRARREKCPRPPKAASCSAAFLDQFKLNPAYRDSSRRETMELQLFAAELLLSFGLGERTRDRPLGT